MDINYLIYKIRSAGDKVETLAKALGIHPMTLRVKMQGKRAFKQNEIEAIATRYALTADEIDKIFFKKGPENE